VSAGQLSFGLFLAPSDPRPGERPLRDTSWPRGRCGTAAIPYGAAVVSAGTPSTLVCRRCTVELVRERRTQGLYVLPCYEWVPS